QAFLDGEGRLAARLAAAAFDRFEERGLFAADVGARAAPQLEVEGEVAAEDALAQQAGRATCANRVREPLVRQRILRANVEVAALAAGGEGRDRHRLDHRERIAA